MNEYGTFQSSMFTLLKILVGEHTVVLQTMLSNEPSWGVMYFVALFLTHVIFIVDIFIGIVISSFNKEMRLLSKQEEHASLHQVLYRIFR